MDSSTLREQTINSINKVSEELDQKIHQGVSKMESIADSINSKIGKSLDENRTAEVPIKEFKNQLNYAPVGKDREEILDEAPPRQVWWATLGLVLSMLWAFSALYAIFSGEGLIGPLIWILFALAIGTVCYRKNESLANSREIFLSQYRLPTTLGGITRL